MRNGLPDLDSSINIDFGRRDGRPLNQDDEDEESDDEDWNGYVRETGWRNTGEYLDPDLWWLLRNVLIPL